MSVSNGEKGQGAGDREQVLLSDDVDCNLSCCKCLSVLMSYKCSTQGTIIAKMQLITPLYFLRNCRKYQSLKECKQKKYCYRKYYFL